MSTLLTSLNFASKKEFSLFLKETYLLKVEVDRKFPEIVNSAKNKIAIESAGKKVMQNIEKPTHTTGDCWVLFLAALSACTQGCAIYYPNDWEGCIEWCYAGAAAGSSTCFLFAD